MGNPNSCLEPLNTSLDNIASKCQHAQYMTPYSQLDPRWSQMIVPTSRSTIGQIGCTLTSCSMIIDQSPDISVNQFKFVNGGYLLWSSVKGFKWLKRPEQLKAENFYTDRQSPTRQLVRDVANFPEKGKGIIFGYLHKLGGGRVTPHWVVMAGLEVGAYKVMDPWGAKLTTLPVSEINHIALIDINR